MLKSVCQFKLLVEKHLRDFVIGLSLKKIR